MSCSDPFEDFVAGRGPWAAALRGLPPFEPPARMEADFRAMLGRLPHAIPAFEPPPSLQAAVLGEIARQQAAQQLRREAVLQEVARGRDAASVLGAPLGAAGEAWLQAQSATAGGPTPQPSRARRASWWRFAAGGLVALLAVGVSLRLMLEQPRLLEPLDREEARVPAFEGKTRRDANESDAPASRSASPAVSAERAPAVVPVLPRAEPSAPAKQDKAELALPPREAVAPHPQQARAVDSQAPLADAPAVREAAAGRMRESLPAVTSSSAADVAEAPAPAMAAAKPAAPVPVPEQALERDAAARRQAAPASPPPPAAAAPAAKLVQPLPTWSLADDPAARLASLSTTRRWLLLCAPADEGLARRWLQQGLAGVSGLQVALTPRADIAAGTLHITPVDPGP